ncbi:hypothetical protein V8G54_025358 [Vigna mungo]|uniref:Uncharacterized protein n=1 Tax=Vigna mungo TaxID=3915 RepID=A0AAQ3RL27_VIGMU
MLGRIHVSIPAKTTQLFSSKPHPVSQLRVSVTTKTTRKSLQLQHVPEIETENHQKILRILLHPVLLPPYLTNVCPHLIQILHILLHPVHLPPYLLLILEDPPNRETDLQDYLNLKRLMHQLLPLILQILL